MLEIGKDQGSAQNRMCWPFSTIKRMTKMKREKRLYFSKDYDLRMANSDWSPIHQAKPISATMMETDRECCFFGNNQYRSPREQHILLQYLPNLISIPFGPTNIFPFVICGFLCSLPSHKKFCCKVSGSFTTPFGALYKDR